MKKLILASLLTLTTTSTWANEFIHKSEKMHCSIKGNVQTIDQTKVDLPHEISFDVMVSETRLKECGINKLIKRTAATTLSSEDQQFVKLSHFNVVRRNGYSNYASFKINSLNSEESKALLVRLGAHEDDASGVSGNFIGLNQIPSCYGNRTSSQLHYNIEQNNGLSFHIVAECR